MKPPSRTNCIDFESLVLFSLSDVFGDDKKYVTLVLLNMFVDQKGYDLIFILDKVGKVNRRYSIKRFAQLFGKARHDLFLHALIGCDYTSRPFGMRQPIDLAVIRKLL